MYVVHAKESSCSNVKQVLGAKRTKFCQTLLHFLKPSLDVGKEVDHHAAAASMMVLPWSWIEAFVGAVDVYEQQAAAQA